MDLAPEIELLCLDVDGVLTDGSILIDDLGRETKRFHVRDGLAIRVWIELGYHVALITGRAGGAVRHRANELGIDHVFSGVANKRDAFVQLLHDLDLDPSRTAVLGDDLPDLPLLVMAGYPMAVADAVPEVLGVAAYVTQHRGGHGAVRDAIEHLLEERGEWDDVVARYGSLR